MLGQRIADLRQKTGMSQAALARRLSISPSAVGMYEQGRREPSVDLLVAISREFGVSLDYLLTGEQESDRNLAAVLMRGLAEASADGITLRRRYFSRQELAVLLVALLMEE